MGGRPATPRAERDRGRGRGGELSRQYVAAAVTFAVLVAAVVLVFGHLLSRSLSRRYLEDVLISGRETARELAREIGAGGGEDIFQVVEKRRETLLRRGTELAQRQVFEHLKVIDRQGRVVWEATLSARHTPSGAVPESLEIGSGLDQEVRDSEKRYEFRAPIGTVGEVVLMLNRGVLAERIQRLRRELLAQTLAAAGITLLTLAGAFAFIWHLVQRNRRLEEQRHRAQELADLGALAANLAHEIRNPLNSININLELLEEDLGGTAPPARASLESTRREVARLARLVTDFLTYARPSEPRPERVAVAELLEDVVGFLGPEAARAGARLEVLPPAGGLEVVADPAQLRQVLLNLVLNALQAVSGLPAGRRRVELGATSRDGRVALFVRDRGDGVPEGELDRIREAFVTGRRGGTGLGLAIAERIARAHGGELELVNLEPHGFEARLVLPSAGEGVTIGGASATAGAEP